MRSPLRPQPSPPMQPCRNRKYAWGEVRVEGPPGTITVRASGLDRYVAVWQKAQLTATRSPPNRAFFVKPIGSSRPGSQTAPMAA